MATFFHGWINYMISTQTFTSLDCVREEGGETEEATKNW
jgi:hypothetical protein